jgi:hypothetical protein
MNRGWLLKGAIMKSVAFYTVAVALVFLAGCQGVYYNTMEKFGYHKREMLVDRVEDARDAQQEAKEQFQSALEQFGAVVNFQGGELEATYKKLKAEYERSESKAKAVVKRIDDVEKVGDALFKEWAAELEQYTNENLRALSEEKLRATRLRYARLVGAMRGAQMKIEPVLSAFRDQVLFLKHNLNAQAVASLQNELVSVKTDVAALIREMEKSISEADAFIKAMDQE